MCMTKLEICDFYVLNSSSETDVSPRSPGYTDRYVTANVDLQSAFC